MKTIYKILFLILVSILYSSSLIAQPTHELFEAWFNCDFSRYQDSGPHHIQMIGNSNGSLYGAYPFGPLAYGYPGTTTPNKSWGKFLQPGPRTGGQWRVLNTAWPGNYSFVARDQLSHCLANPNFLPEKASDGSTSTVSENLKRKYLATTPKRVWIQIGGNDLRTEVENMWSTEFLPHLAHYRQNAVLNNIGKMIELLQANGRTVVLASYFPLSTEFVRNEHLNNRPLERALCEPVDRLADLEVNFPDIDNNIQPCNGSDRRLRKTYKMVTRSF